MSAAAEDIAQERQQTKADRRRDTHQAARRRYIRYARCTLGASQTRAMLDFARVHRVAAQFNSERTRHRGLRKTRVGARVQARIGAASADCRAATSKRE